MSQRHARPDASLLLATPTDTIDRNDDVQLTVVIPRRVRQALLQHATGKGTTARSVILRLLRDAGIAEVDDADLVDRRSTPNTMRRGPA